jgi:formylglycine-generating enzyme required for sulfatase activity
VLWGQGGGEGEARFYAGVPEDQHRSKGWEALSNARFIPRTYQVFRGLDGKRRFSAVWGKRPVNPAWQNLLTALEREYLTRSSGEKVRQDVCLYPADPPRTPRQRRLDELAQAEKDLKARPGNNDLLARRGYALFRLGRDAEALRDLSEVIKKATNPRYYYGHLYRARVHARQGRGREALLDLMAVQKRGAPLAKVLFADLVVMAHLGLEQQGLQRLEAAIPRRRDDPSFLYDAACAYAQAAEVLPARQAARVAGFVAAPGLLNLARLPAPGTDARACADRAVALLRQAWRAGYANSANLESDADLDPIRQHPGFQAFCREEHFERRYSTIWYVSTTLESTDLHGLNPAEHRARFRRLAEQGYRPAALSVAEIVGGQPPVTASAWHRPVVPEAERAALARRQANAAIAQFHLGQTERPWPLLRHTRRPDARSWLIGRLGPFGVDAGALVRRLEAETDASTRRALILALGEYTAEQVPADLRRRVVPRLLDWYQRDPDPGIHGAVDWLLRHGREGPQPRKLDWQQGEAVRALDRALAGKAPARGQRWYVSKTGLTMVVIPGPVEFDMGAPGHETERRLSEVRHRRRIERSYAISAKLITRRQFQAFLDAHPEVRHTFTRRYCPDVRGPVISLTWYEAAQYCRWLSEKEGVPEDQMCYPPVAVIQRHKTGNIPLKLPADYLQRTGYRLPTEAEWEYACRAGAVTPRHFGIAPELLPGYAWYQGNSRDRVWPVGQKKPNDFGLFDMHGNTGAWCHEALASYPAGVPGHPALDRAVHADVIPTVDRIVRGGSFFTRPSSVRSAARGYYRPRLRNVGIGLRVARTHRPAAPPAGKKAGP